MLRRIGSGRRAEVFLAVADRYGADEAPVFVPHGVDGVHVEESEAPPLVAVRIYRDEVDDASVACEIEAMHVVPDAGMPALLDVSAAVNGSRVAVVERVGGATVAQLLHERSLEPGEAVTLVAPIAAGLACLADAGFVHAGLTTSDVKLDSSGRPRLLGLGGLERVPIGAAEATAVRREGSAALIEYLEQVVGAVRPAGVFDGPIRLARAGLDARPFRAFEADLERAMFAAASPAPIAGLPPAREVRIPARALAPRPAETPMDPMAQPSRSGRKHSRSGLAAGVLELAELPPPVLERLAAAADSDRLATIRHRLSDWVSTRRRPVMVGALVGAAALVLLLTAVPSAGAGERGTADRPSVASAEGAGAAGAAAGAEFGSDGTDRAKTEAAETAGENTPGDDASAEAAAGEGGAGNAKLVPEDPIAAAQELLQVRGSCFDELDPACLASYVQAGSPLEEADWSRMLAARDGGPGIRSLDPTRIEVVTEMGAAVLVRVVGVGNDEPASLLMVRSEAGWRLREIFD
ncbi:hypothetical protein ATC03_10405 [Agromyces aureus]|uniref:Protein kinase domain-containing protein n=2 Tax=Agromyces aureus TaxID=453304 RepID=A0A191WFW8_9MICO|nr:hypothetical protein ATC03_10405 [Agromyces aureus]